MSMRRRLDSADSVLHALAKSFRWGLGFAAIGGVIGWLLRSERGGKQVADAPRSTVDLEEVERLRHRVADLEPIIGERDRLRERIRDLEVGTPAAALTSFAEVGAAAPAGGGGFEVEHDLDHASTVMGRKVKLDDLEVVEGIGPVLSGVLIAGGISTWSGLGSTTPDVVKGILVAADERHRMHDPGSWPRQARLAAIGEWEALRHLQDGLRGGR